MPCRNQIKIILLLSLAVSTIFFCSPTTPENLDELYGVWNLVERIILGTPNGTIRETPETANFQNNTLTINKNGSYSSATTLNGKEKIENGTWKAEGSNIISFKVKNSLHRGTFKVKKDALTIELTIALDYDQDGYPESYTVIQEFKRKS